MTEDQAHDGYDERDLAIMAGNIFNRLCALDEGWYDIRILANEVKAYENRSDVAYIAEAVLVEKGFIERDPYTINVRLTPLGRQSCGTGIEIPPSDIQSLRGIVENVTIIDKVEAKVVVSSKLDQPT